MSTQCTRMHHCATDTVPLAPLDQHRYTTRVYLCPGNLLDFHSLKQFCYYNDRNGNRQTTKRDLTVDTADKSSLNRTPTRPEQLKRSFAVCFCGASIPGHPSEPLIVHCGTCIGAKK